MNIKRLLRAAGAFGVLSVGFGATAVGCLNRPIDRLDTRTTSTVVERLQQSGVDKIDLLLTIDNSISMADKQQILAAAVPDLVSRLITPICVDDEGVAIGDLTVDDAGKCSEGKPEFPPIRDINIGVISSSLGDLTSDACKSAGVPHPDDKGRLLTRTKAGTPAPTDFEGKGFLGWDPDNKRGGQANPGTLTSDLTNMVIGVDQVGCGYEMTLESVLRFLVDPDPYDSIMREGNQLVEVGTDEVVLTQRKDFLRPDSLLAILILSDENDCSLALKNAKIDDERSISGQGFLALATPFAKSTSECETDPNDPCCTSCGLNPASGCDAGGNCDDNGGNYTDAQDHRNLKCYRQKERYGVDFLYPTSRYVNAFTQFRIDPDNVEYKGDAVENPLFQDLQGSGAPIRGQDLVFVAGIVGVPWQAIANKNADDQPDLALGFKTYDQLQPDLTYLIGDPDKHIDPEEPFMIEATEPRTGTSKLTGASPTGDNPINGHDYTIYDTSDPAAGPDDLEFACIFDLAVEVPDGPDCGGACTEANGCDNPLCKPGELSTQIKAKAYPGLRHLAVLRGMGTQGIFASICPAEVNNLDSPIYGYRPAVNTIINRLKEQLGGQCLPRELKPVNGVIPCLVIEARKFDGTCECLEGEGRTVIPEQIDGAPNPTFNAVKAAQESDFANPDWNCFCEIEQFEAGTDGWQTCLTNEDPKAAEQGSGWCYVDSSPGSTCGDSNDPAACSALVGGCPPDESQLVRFVGGGEPKTGSTVFVTCSGD